MRTRNFFKIKLIAGQGKKDEQTLEPQNIVEPAAIDNNESDENKTKPKAGSTSVGQAFTLKM